jgi:CRP-like cAMP-binding protein
VRFDFTLGAAGVPAPRAERIRHTLWRDTHSAPDRSVTYTHEELAARASTDRPTATRVLGGLERAGIIAVDRSKHRIVIIDSVRLTAGE